jgi:hypothetical protein
MLLRNDSLFLPDCRQHILGRDVLSVLESKEEGYIGWGLAGGSSEKDTNRVLHRDKESNIISMSLFYTLGKILESCNDTVD